MKATKTTHSIDVTIYRREMTTDTYGYKNVPDRIETWSVELTIDIDAILRELGGKAVKSTCGRSKDGHVSVKRIRRISARPCITTETNITQE